MIPYFLDFYFKNFHRFLFLNEATSTSRWGGGHNFKRKRKKFSTRQQAPLVEGVDTIWKKICPTLNEKCLLPRCQWDVLETSLPLVAITGTSCSLFILPTPFLQWFWRVISIFVCIFCTSTTTLFLANSELYLADLRPVVWGHSYAVHDCELLVLGLSQVPDGMDLLGELHMVRVNKG